MAPHQQELRGRFHVVTYTCWGVAVQVMTLEGRASGLGVRALGYPPGCVS